MTLSMDRTQLRSTGKSWLLQEIKSRDKEKKGKLQGEHPEAWQDRKGTISSAVCLSSGAQTRRVSAGLPELAGGRKPRCIWTSRHGKEPRPEGHTGGVLMSGGRGSRAGRRRWAGPGHDPHAQRARAGRMTPLRLLFRMESPTFRKLKNKM